MDIMDHIKKPMKEVKESKPRFKDGKCKGFKKGDDGYCINYSGPKPFISSCASQCNRKFRKSKLEE